MVVGGWGHAPAALPREWPGTHCIGGWVCPRVGRDGLWKSCPSTGIRPPDRPACSESLYCLSSPGLKNYDKYTGLSKKMDGIWNRYNLKSTGRIYTFGVLKCSEEFKVLDLP